MNETISEGWNMALKHYFSHEAWSKLKAFVDAEYEQKTIYPKKNDIFRALTSTPFDSVKVVILGQDPYHNPNQAHGLAFSVVEGVTPPPSLKNIYKELKDDLAIEKDMRFGNLSSWSEQGVLLLNAVLTVEKNKPGSHAKKGWELFTDTVIASLSSRKEHCVFILWGAYAKKKGKGIDRSKHLVLESAHPSPFSAYNGFFGNHHFSKTNEYLMSHGKSPIEW